MKRSFRIAVEVLLGTAVLLACGVGIALGVALASTENIEIANDLEKRQLALPSRILDRDGRLITEYFSEEKRNMVSIDELPRHTIYAIVTAEDRSFFQHHGFDLIGMIRALWNNLRGTYFSGASTITQQIAGELYTDRSEITYKRKLVELWYAFQMERSLTKYQILELYLNTVYLGHNTHGIEAASQFYFGHSARENKLAESAMLVLQIRSPATYSMINHPNRARDGQRVLLDQMVDLGYVTEEDADRSFQLFWDNYNVTRSNRATAYFENESRAPYFTEYVRLQLGEILYGAMSDINREGFTIHTTLDLDMQRTAQELMANGIYDINKTYRRETKARMEEADRLFIPTVEALSLLFDMEQIEVAGIQQSREAKNYFYEEVNPLLDLLSLHFDESQLKAFTYDATDLYENRTKQTTVEGALITLGNDSHNTGHILAMVGGSDFKTKQFNRAVDATRQPGSAFKPLYYSAAISSRTITPATMIVDAPVVFFNADGSKYEPVNYLGAWSGRVRARTALAHSMNVPSSKVLDMIGFDLAIERTSRLLGMYDRRNNESVFPRKYPLALGVVTVAPINMARAYATFANQGRAVEPIAIRYIEDRNGSIIVEHENDMIDRRQRKSEEELRILTPQEAYIMVSMLQSTVEEGTLMRRRLGVGGFDGMPMAGKTGTTQNWSDAWTVGFSPYYTTAVWFGFDLQGESLGRNQTGATAAGPVWAQYMKSIHKDLPKKEFIRPESGLITRKVCAVSGLLLTEECDDGSIDEIFLSGTQPERFCDVHPYENQRDRMLQDRLKERLSIENVTFDALERFELPRLELGDMPEPTGPDESKTGGRSTDSGEGNPLLD